MKTYTEHRKDPRYADKVAEVLAVNQRRATAGRVQSAWVIYNSSEDVYSYIDAATEEYARGYAAELAVELCDPRIYRDSPMDQGLPDLNVAIRLPKTTVDNHQETLKAAFAQLNHIDDNVATLLPEPTDVIETGAIHRALGVLRELLAGRTTEGNSQ